MTAALAIMLFLAGVATGGILILWMLAPTLQAFVQMKKINGKMDRLIDYTVRFKTQSSPIQEGSAVSVNQEGVEVFRGFESSQGAEDA